VGRSLGRGGMGEVFHAVDEQLGRTVAIKLMLPSSGDLTSAERFRREARAAARLSDPHVVAVYDFGQYGDQFFLVMELVEGRTVAAELAERGPLPKDRAIDIVEQSAAGLAVAHHEDVVHRDVKPGNLLLTPDGTVKVADFGIAHLPGDGATTLTGTGQIIGSLRYLAPERAQGGRAGKASDVYSLGCVLYELVTGQPPFTAEHPTAVLYQHVDTPPSPPSAIRPELAGAFEAVLLRMLAKDPTARPSAAEIAAGALRAPDNEVNTAALVPGAPIIGVPSGDGLRDRTAALRPAAGPPRPDRRKVLMAGAIAVVAVAAAVAAVLLNNGPNLPATTDVGPKPGVTSGTPGAGSTNDPTLAPTQTDGANQPTRSTSAQPSQSPSQQGSPTPQSPSPSDTQSPTPRPSESTTSSTPTQSTPTPTTSQSNTPRPDPTSTPPAGTPTP